MVSRIVNAAGDVPVSADLDDGYDDAGESVRRAIGVGIVGANVEDRLRPLAESSKLSTPGSRAARSPANSASVSQPSSARPAREMSRSHAAKADWLACSGSARAGLSQIGRCPLAGEPV